MPEVNAAPAARVSTSAERDFFTRMADRILAISPATTVLDVGCSTGMLVQALAVRGADSSGIDISEHAVESAHPDVRDRLRVGSAAEKIDGPYDLITCIEVLQHIDAAQAQDAIDAMCGATTRIVFSSSPLDVAEPTHINVHDTRQWAAWFADRGFFRRTEVDLGFITPWAILFERAELTSREVVDRYETALNPLLGEMLAKRDALLASQREVARLADDGSGGSGQAARLEDEVRTARHTALISRDQVIGSEAEVGRVNRDLTKLQQELRASQRKVRKVTERRNELQKQLGVARQRVERLQGRVAGLETELTAARTSLPRRVARALRRRLR